jgi:hypothetical protein
MGILPAADEEQNGIECRLDRDAFGEDQKIESVELRGSNS